MVRRCSSRTHTCTSLCPDILTRSFQPWHVPRLEVVHTSHLKTIQFKHINIQCCESFSCYIVFMPLSKTNRNVGGGPRVTSVEKSSPHTQHNVDCSDVNI